MARGGLTGAGHEAVPEEQVLHGGGPVEGGRVGVVDGEGQGVGRVIVQIAPDAREIVDHRDTDCLELGLRAHAAVQEDLRRVHRSCASGKLVLLVYHCFQGGAYGSRFDGMDFGVNFR